MTVRDTLRILAPVLGAKRIERLWMAYLAANALDKRELEYTLEAYAAHRLKDTPVYAAPGWKKTGQTTE